MSESIPSQSAIFFSVIFHGRQGLAFAVRMWDGWGWSLPGGAWPYQEAEV
jgi:hypothetical protein